MCVCVCVCLFEELCYYSLFRVITVSVCVCVCLLLGCAVACMYCMWVGLGLGGGMSWHRTRSGWRRSCRTGLEDVIEARVAEDEKRGRQY